MTHPILGITLEGRQSLQKTHEWFSRSDPTILIGVLSLVGFILLALCVAALWQRIQDWQLEPVRRQPMALFRRLQRKLGIPWLDRWFLWRLARRLDLPHPTALLVSDLFFDQCLAQLTATGRSSHHLARFRTIRTHLFGRPTAGDPAAPPAAPPAQ